MSAEALNLKLYKAAKKTLEELESRFDYIEATSDESEALRELRQAVLACEASTMEESR